MMNLEYNGLKATATFGGFAVKDLICRIRHDL